MRDIELEHATDESAFLQIVCPHCESVSQAHVMISLGDPLKVGPVESIETDMTEYERLQLQNAIDKHKGGVSELFSSL